VAFAGNQQHIATCEIHDRGWIAIIAVADLVGAGGAAQNRGPDCAGLFAAVGLVRSSQPAMTRSAFAAAIAPSGAACGVAVAASANTTTSLPLT